MRQNLSLCGSAAILLVGLPHTAFNALIPPTTQANALSFFFGRSIVWAFGSVLKTICITKGYTEIFPLCFKMDLAINGIDCKTGVVFAGSLAKAPTPESIESLDTSARSALAPHAHSGSLAPDFFV